MSRIPRTTLLLVLATVASVATATTAAARDWPGDPVPDPAPASPVIDQVPAATPMWHFIVVAALAALVVGIAAYVAGSRTRRGRLAGDPASVDVSAASVA